MLREMDIPPVWLGLALVLAWAMSGSGWHFAGAVLVLAGLTVMAAALWQMRRARTTFIPRRDPAAMVTGGIFGLSRNPIYLGDALVLLGAVVWWGSWLALPLVPVFMLWITRRYILDEEARLQRGFGPAYQSWALRVPRWLWRV